MPSKLENDDFQNVSAKYLLLQHTSQISEFEIHTSSSASKLLEL